MEGRDIAFMGKITAAITHEMNNVLAIIRESGGLMEDIMAMSKDVEFPYRDKFQTGLKRIKDQVVRGTELSKRLNKFAHSMDEVAASSELTDLLDHAVFLNQRFARQKQTTLGVDPNAAAEKYVKTRPFNLLQLLTACINCCLENSEPEAAITFYIAEEGGNACIDVVMEPGSGTLNLDDISTGFCDAAHACNAVNVVMESLNDKFGVRLKFV